MPFRRIAAALNLTDTDLEIPQRESSTIASELESTRDYFKSLVGGVTNTDRIDGKLLQLTDMLEKAITKTLPDERQKQVTVIFDSCVHAGVDCCIEIHLSGGDWSSNEITHVRNVAFEYLWQYFLHRGDVVFLFSGIFEVKE